MTTLITAQKETRRGALKFVYFKTNRRVGGGGILEIEPLLQNQQEGGEGS